MLSTLDDKGLHADQEERRSLTQGMRHADDRAGHDAGHGERQDMVQDAWCLEAPTPSAASRIDGGTAFSAARVQ